MLRTSIINFKLYINFHVFKHLTYTKFYFLNNMYYKGYSPENADLQR